MNHSFQSRIDRADEVAQGLPFIADEHLRAVGASVIEVATQLIKQREAVWAARRVGTSWHLIGMAMGTSRQSVANTFGEPPPIEPQMRSTSPDGNLRVRT